MRAAAIETRRDGRIGRWWTGRTAISRTVPGLCVVALAIVGGFLFAGSAHAQSVDISGSWKGSGTVTLPSGAQEEARCNVRYSRNSGSTYSATAVCATASAKVNQTASLERVGNNRFEGTFYSPEHGISGSVAITLQGANSQSVTLNGGGGSASIKLSR